MLTNRKDINVKTVWLNVRITFKPHSLMTSSGNSTFPFLKLPQYLIASISLSLSASHETHRRRRVIAGEEREKMDKEKKCCLNLRIKAVNGSSP